MLERQASTIAGLLRYQAGQYANHDLLVVAEQTRPLWPASAPASTYQQVLEQVDRKADQYRDAGYGSGHRVALLLENRPAHFIHWLALNTIGASMVPINPALTDAEFDYLLTDSQAQLIVALDVHIERARSIAQHHQLAVCLDTDTDFPVASSKPAGSPEPDELTECALLYTSGTTGKPKGCLLSNDYFLGWADWYLAQGGYISLRPGAERLITPLPTFHINATGNSFIGMLASGGAQIIVDRFHPRSWWQSATQSGATCFHYLGVMPAMLMQLPESEYDRAHSLRFGMGGGVHPAHHRNFEERFGVPLLEGWAMTETGGGGILVAASDPRHVGQRCIGPTSRPGPQMRARLIDESGNDVADGQPGELLVQACGPNPRRRFFSGYLHDEAQTEKIWAGDWLHTGDIMRKLPDGSLCFVDRSKNIVRRSGENISAIEVESALITHPAVNAVAVAPAPDPIREEEVLAAVIVDPDAIASQSLARQLLEYCLDSLVYYKLPGYIVFVDKLPTTSTQKVRKADLTFITENLSTLPDVHDLRELKQQHRQAGR